jgi:hypothetical protein
MRSLCTAGIIGFLCRSCRAPSRRTSECRPSKNSMGSGDFARMHGVAGIGENLANGVGACDVDVVGEAGKLGGEHVAVTSAAVFGEPHRVAHKTEHLANRRQRRSGGKTLRHAHSANPPGAPRGGTGRQRPSDTADDTATTHSGSCGSARGGLWCGSFCRDRRGPSLLYFRSIEGQTSASGCGPCGSRRPRTGAPHATHHLSCLPASRVRADLGRDEGRW